MLKIHLQSVITPPKHISRKMKDLELWIESYINFIAIALHSSAASIWLVAKMTRNTTKGSISCLKSGDPSKVRLNMHNASCRELGDLSADCLLNESSCEISTCWYLLTSNSVSRVGGGASNSLILDNGP
jgi:hypothetical protein